MLHTAAYSLNAASTYGKDLFSGINAICFKNSIR